MTAVSLELLPRSTVLTPGPGRKRTTEELKAIAEEAGRRFDDRGLYGNHSEIDPAEVLAWAGETFGDALAVACSMANTVVPEMTAQHAPGVDVLFLDTGYHFSETVGVRDALAATPGLNVVDVRSPATREEHEAALGPRPYETDPEMCCRLRKVEPLDAALSGYEAWITGLRRVDTDHRAGAAMVEWDEKHSMVKINPLVAWTMERVHDYAAEHGCLLNPLLDDGYPSIGCEPCTRRVEAGADPRSGRWAGSSKTECGIHL
ncbi:phosphoadenylyl-sulfate reductase [Dietzia cinnamea]|uniref:phosphoadenylyl-sulfate reductase n=1 Tax=Dietzia cinnamea TaxID=321318 RepID=UPI0021AED4A9|nr:phosphoadenylyl-sulfate reductase [Dietzia cinnamea]MCT2302821.1 phosphoadenylyl-sulfate reductase [Dietzia cinnamea]